MDETEQDQRPINGRPAGAGRLRSGVEIARAPVDGVRAGADRARLAVEDAAWFMRERVAWPVEDRLDALGTRGKIGVFGGGGIAVAGVVAALLIASPGAGTSHAGATEAFVASTSAPTPASVIPAPKPQPKAAKPSGPTLHGAPPSFTSAQVVQSGVGDGEALGGKADSPTGGLGADRGATVGSHAAARGSSAGAGDTPAATARIGATPAASAAATAQATSLDKAINSGVPKVGGEEEPAGAEEVAGPPAPKAAKQVARHFAEAFVVYETGGVDSEVRGTFAATSTKQLSKSLLKRPPRQPAGVKVPQAKVVNVVAGPSEGKVYSVSVSLLRVGVTSELRLQMEQGVGKKWQVTNVLG
jgi:hypothetical protein